MKNLKILVIGSAGTGKSAISQHICELLSKDGFDVSNSDDDEIHYPTENDLQKLRMENVKNQHTKLEVLTQQLARESA